MPKITFENTNQTIEVAAGSSMLEAALDNDIPLQHACGEFCSCTTCRVVVKSGMDQISAMDEDEKERLNETDQLAPDARLACQCKVSGDVTVEICNLDA